MTDLQTYYDRTRFDYRHVWNRSGSLAVHFGYYDAHAHKHRFALDNMNRALADLAHICPGEQVLDAGCGMGGSCFWLARERGAIATGISIVISQVVDCQREAARQKAGQVTFLQADYCQTPFPDDHFDVVWACESVCHTAQKSDFYKEAFRILKPGGRLVMAEYLRTARSLPPASERLLEQWLRPWAIPDLNTMEEHRTNAQAAGFQEIEIRDVTDNVRVSLRNLHEISVRWLPIGRLLHRFGLVHAVRLGNAQAAVRQWEALEVGAWRYGMLVARKGMRIE